MKKTFRLPLLLLAIGVAVMGAFAFSSKPAANKNFSTVYHYVGPFTNAGVKEPSNWVAESTSCGTAGDAPCAITYNGTRQQFDAEVANFADMAAATTASDKKQYQ